MLSKVERLVRVKHSSLLCLFDSERIYYVTLFKRFLSLVLLAKKLEHEFLASLFRLV